MTENQEELLQRVAGDVAVLKGAIVGNGTKGLSDRVEEMEEWKNTHPRLCFLVEHIAGTVSIAKERKVSGANILFGVIGAVGVLGSLLVAVLK